MCRPDRLASCYSVHDSRDLVQVPVRRRAAERDADGQRPADHADKTTGVSLVEATNQAGRLLAVMSIRVRDPAACPGAVGVLSSRR